MAQSLQPSRIKKLRERKRLTQHDLASKLRGKGFGTTQTTISRWEKDQSPHSNAIPALAEALGVEVSELYGEADDDEESDAVAVLMQGLRALVREAQREETAA